MQLFFDGKLVEGYKSQSQKTRILTENWVYSYVFCPSCGLSRMKQYKANKPVADFYCNNCGEDYELKSKSGVLGNKILDGAFKTKILRLKSYKNPSLFLLNYKRETSEVLSFLVIPKHFFVPEMIERRKPLSVSAKRSGWVGSNIILNNVPQSGKIYYVKNKGIKPKRKVLFEWKKTVFLRDEKEFSSRGWLLDILRCVEKLNKKNFTLDDMYAFQEYLTKLHPRNKHIKEKTRQQLQILRDEDYLEFLGNGQYRIS